MLSARAYRKWAKAYRAQAAAPGLAPNKATLLKNISRSLSALASQLEMLAVYDDEVSRPSSPPSRRPRSRSGRPLLRPASRA
jgi:hypothetical protein